MKAMLYADWRSVRRSVKAILWVVLVMSVAASAFGGVMVVPFMLPMLSLMFPATLMNTDHAYGWDKLSLTLPVSRRDVVGSKFTVSLLVNLAAFALSIIIFFILYAPWGKAKRERISPPAQRNWLIGGIAGFAVSVLCIKFTLENLPL